MSAAILCGLLLTCATYAEDRLAGIGVQVAGHHHALTVIQVLPNTLASKAGLSSSLLVQRIDGTVTAGKTLKERTDLLRGAVGTKVKLELIDADHSKTDIVELSRAEIKQ
jgi:carboxyl-terminal processing protease